MRTVPATVVVAVAVVVYHLPNVTRVLLLMICHLAIFHPETCQVDRFPVVVGDEVELFPLG